MKKSLFFSFLLVTLLSFSCTKDQIDQVQESPDKAEARLAINTVSNIFLKGTWSITSFITNNSETALKYKECCFAFATNGSLIAKDATNSSVVGKWTVGYIDNQVRISFVFFSNSDFTALDGSWTVIKGVTPKKVAMQGVPEQSDYLTLEQQ